MAVIVREKVKGSGEWWIFINHKGRRRSKKSGDKRTANTVARKVKERLAAGLCSCLPAEYLPARASKPEVFSIRAKQLR